MGAGASTSSDAQLFTGEAADKGISFEQLQAAVAQQPSSTREQWTADRLKTAFEQHDADGDGFLSKAEYEAAVASTGGGAKDFGRDLPGAAEAAGMRQESEEAIDTAMMAAASRRTWSGQQQDETTVAVALSLAHEVKSAFLGAEVKKASNVDTMFIDAWGHLGRGEVDAALQLADKLCSGDKTNEKFFYTRAVCHARKASWRFALADYSTYLKLVQTTSGPALANALYGRALCLAKLGKRALALRDLDECIRVGPPDEQVTEPDASLVPMAVIARFCLLQACPELQKQVNAMNKQTEKPKQATSLAEAAKQAADEKQRQATSATNYDDEAMWVVEVTDLETAIEKALTASRTPLLIDATKEKAVDGYYLYTPSAVVEAKKVVLDVRVAGMSIDAAREQLREQLVHAMRWGLTLLIRLSNSAADFQQTYCSDDCFPHAVFDRTKLPTGRDAAADPIFSKILRPADVQKEGGRLHVPASFRVCVSSFFKVYAHTASGTPRTACLPPRFTMPLRLDSRCPRRRPLTLPRAGRELHATAQGCASDAQPAADARRGARERHAGRRPATGRCGREAAPQGPDRRDATDGRPHVAGLAGHRPRQYRHSHRDHGRAAAERRAGLRHLLLGHGMNGIGGVYF